MLSRLRAAVLLSCAVSSALMLVSACERVPLMAPTGSTITLTTATSTLGFNGTADVVAQVIEPAGTAPHSGTHVTFIASLGSMDPPEVQTDVNGRAVSHFHSGSASGIATITASSGGSSVTAANAIKIAVGSAAVGTVVASANPAVVSSSGGSSTISAKVADTGGNVLTGIPVTFSTDNGSLSAATANTDSTGVATSVLTTNKTAKVTVTAGIPTTTTTPPPSGGTGSGTTTTTAPATATVNVTVNITASITMTGPTPASPAAGQAVAFALTYGTGGTTGASPITRLTVDWGDGVVNNYNGAPASISHVYNNPGGYLAVVTGYDALGDTSNASGGVTVTPRLRPTITITASAPASGLVTFTIAATATTGNQIVSIAIDFGDGDNRTLSGNVTSVQHVYTASGTYQVTAAATDSSGTSSSASTVVVIPK